MSQNTKNKFISISQTIVILIISVLIAIFSEDYYRQLIRYIFKFVNGDHIQFIGKNFHLFASFIFVLAFALFSSTIFLLLKYFNKASRLKRGCWVTIIFFTSTILIPAIDSKRLIIECTACNDGIRRLAYNEITYDKYFIISLSITFVYLFSIYIKERKTR